MAINCSLFSSYLFRRTPNFMKELVEDLHPRDVNYINMYQNEKWPSFTGTQHFRDRMHVAMPNDEGNWEQIDAGACVMAICDPESRQIDWGSTRSNFFKFRRRWKTRILCLDQLRNVEEAENQLESIWKGLMRVPEYVTADWMKFQITSGSNFIYSCGAAGTQVAVTPTMFANGLASMNIGTANLPTSKLNMPFLQNNCDQLIYNGYFDGEFTPAGTFKCITDFQTQQELSNGNPALAGMYQAADFEKGGKFYKYGVMKGVGNYLFQIDPYMPRFQNIGNGLLQRVWPYQNLPTTVGLNPVYDTSYKNAPYQLSYVTHRLARKVYTGDISPIHPKMPFGTRDLYGKWNWINDAYLQAFDPNTGASCSMENPVRNKGYFLGDFEMGVENIRPELELAILHLREPNCVTDSPRAAALPTQVYQSILPYNSFCDSNPEES